MFWQALEEIAPEALEDLACLVPVYREAAPHMDRPGWYIGIYDWESLGTALEVQTGVPGFEGPGKGKGLSESPSRLGA
jgi:hypothetical protein